MSEPAPSVLRRMIRRARPVGATDARAEAVRIEIARLADDLLGLEAAVISTSLSFQERADIRVGDRDLIFEMNHDLLSSGLVSLSPDLLSTLIEVQIAGRVAATAPPDRAPTRTDAVVVSPMLDAWIDALRDGDAAQPAFRGFRRGAMIQGPKAAYLTLNSGRFAVYSMRLSLGGGAREGQLSVHLPEQADEARAPGSSDLTFITVDLDVVLTRLKRPLGRVRALKPGDVIELDPEVLGQASLEHRGRRLAQVRIGRIDQTRAIRLAEPGPSDRTKGAFTRDGATAPAMPVIAAEPIPEQPATPSRAAVPDAPSLPELAQVDDLPPLGDLPPLDDLPALDDLPDLGDLPPLPELEDL